MTTRALLQSDQAAAPVPPECIRLSVLGGFELHSHVAISPALAPEAQRLIALLALRDRPMSRAAVAGTLWPEASKVHAHASLRSALSRLCEPAREAIVITAADLALGPDVIVDLRSARALAQRLLEPAAPPEMDDLGLAAIQSLSTDCLPDWYEDWAIVESEEWRQLRLHALDSLTLHLTAAVASATRSRQRSPPSAPSHYARAPAPRWFGCTSPKAIGPRRSARSSDSGSPSVVRWGSNQRQHSAHC